MSATPPPTTGDSDLPALFDQFRAVLAAHLDTPADYWQQLTNLLSLYLGILRRQHRHCTTDGCATCQALADVTALAHAHNSLQTFDEIDETDLPYPLLSAITSHRGPHQTQAGVTA